MIEGIVRKELVGQANSCTIALSYLATHLHGADKTGRTFTKDATIGCHWLNSPGLK